MQIHFTKMQGCGNDYVYISGFSEHILQEKKPDFVRAMSDRHFGIGGEDRRGRGNFYQSVGKGGF